ncbi:MULTISPECIES: hypothetical protein [Nocardia]|uniref:Uncharacterized protein n=1 Tax=Nocardia aurea TaxID=2144174 RepID=A0ABV3FNQ3_9NOCA|nr:MULTISPECIES: hypothetical protein [Nocardia]
MTNRPTRCPGRPDTAPLASLAVMLGVIMMLVAVAGSDRIPGWAADYGTALIAMAVVAYLAVAGRILHWGVGELLDPADDRM